METDFAMWEAAFMERQHRARETLGGMLAAKATNLPPADKAEIIRSLARLARHGFTVSTSAEGGK